MERNVLVTGAGRGIGLALVKHLLANGHRVWATYRRPESATELLTLEDQNPLLSTAQLDVAEPSSISVLKEKWKHLSLDWIINNAGYYGPKGMAFGEVDVAEWQKVFATNTIGPYLIAEAFVDCLEDSDAPKLAFLSSKVGSIEDNQSGGGYLYRSSKAALNQVIKSLSIDLRHKGISVVALHPGWVKTAMGGPNALISVDVSVEGLLSVIELLDLSKSGAFINYDGSQIPW
ncbi:SDR family oxidoreductase [Marinomonas mediterranea]|jgi:Dehydrogenases with different specificities (related to short-chain alcohol dehydrogenases)|uniref:Short-chain dehydrogenase/reductase SDR n=1 Tax=Marinomonas mediterranea (strain ATCC 700492 / JCM 21426 / NBRC 103028 / MMB-1) TaxID=717774 RepID=F2K289_MARM1|nr:SDR family oxidoreductase [Marinomonas mediterranea]ADZ91167.1 short-chain dehydrogenase/reductase SDR [Marinomonas mediterranea MMB-1]WCN17296.1 SDR family NAD(P)-dependent oxidoreductase [Marinomonas mediterranea MMB-1]